MKIKEIAKKAVDGTKKHAPLILSVASLVAAGATVVLAVKESPKVKLAIQDKKIEKEEAIRAQLPEDKKDEEIEVKLGAIETGKIVIKHCYPAIIAAIASIASTCASQVISGKRLKASEFARNAAEDALSSYVEQTVKKVGEKKADDIKTEVAKAAVEKNPPNKEVLIQGKGDILCYDLVTQNYFYSTVNAINQARNNVNAAILEGEFVTINDFYDEIGIKHVRYGDDLGWSIEPGDAKREFMNINYIPKLNEDDELILAINYIAKNRYTLNEVTGDENEEIGD